MMASQVLEMIEATPEARRETVMLVTLTRLLVENFVLNARLMGAKKP